MAATFPRTIDCEAFGKRSFGISFVNLRGEVSWDLNQLAPSATLSMVQNEFPSLRDKSLTRVLEN
jgi:hypothetical protein